MIRKATTEDILAITKVYNLLHDEEEAGRCVIGWMRDVYPTKETAILGVELNDMFVLEKNNEILAAGRINQEQVKEYENCNWKYSARPESIMVLHTLVVNPKEAGKGYGKEFVAFYEEYAIRNNCKYLRMDTNERNENARRLYKKLGYKEPGIVDCNFNGISKVRLVCLEKKL